MYWGAQEHQKTRKTTMVDEGRKKTFTTVGQIENTPQEVGVSVIKTTIKRSFHVNTKDLSQHHPMGR